MNWQNCFPQILDMSRTGAIVICVVLILRLILKRAPRAFSYALWAVVLFRLLCPVTLTAPVGVLRETETVRESYTLADTPVTFADAAEAAYRAVGDAANGGLGVQHIQSSGSTAAGRWWEIWVLFGQYVWLAGVGVMLLHALVQHLVLRRTLVGAVRLQDNVWCADRIGMPFVAGVLRPKIYLPSSLDESERGYVIAHEQHHIRRGDPLWRLLAFAALCLHWFNPLVWLAFALSRKDMEMSCDEAVTREMDGDARAAYSESLLRFATGKRVVVAPLAFGEGDTKERIVHVMKYKKTALWATALAAVLCVSAVTAFAFNAERKPEKKLTAQEALDALEASVRWEGENNVFFTIPKDYAPVSNWNIHISGRALPDDGMSMSVHFYDEETWEAGREYGIWLYDLTELIMTAWLPGEDGGAWEREIDLLTGARLPESAGRAYSAPNAAWEADLDGDGTAERIVLDVGLLEENAFSVPWIESADGTKLCELDPVGRPHATWNTYALLEMDGRAYLFQYDPHISTGAAGFSYCIWSVNADTGHLMLESGKSISFPTYAPMTGEEIDAVVEFVNIVNGYWKYSRLLFTTDEGFVRGLVQQDGRPFVTDAPVICGKSGGPSFVEELPWVTDELTEAGLYKNDMSLRERLETYQELAEQRYAQYLETFSD